MTTSMKDNTEKNRFEYEKDGHTVFANYRINNNVLYIDYVEAPKALRGTGAAGALMSDIVEHARHKNLRIQPICGYAAAWLQRHSENREHSRPSQRVVTDSICVLKPCMVILASMPRFRPTLSYRFLWPLLCGVLLLSACTTGRGIQSGYATGYRVNTPVQCVPYARKMSGITLYGDAHTWWNGAASRYPRGYTPIPGSVMVMSRTGSMTHGHLAVVKRVINSREIDVTHSNWGNDHATRSIIYDFMRVQDISSANNWSLVRLWNPHVNGFGAPYPVQGFIYR